MHLLCANAADASMEGRGTQDSPVDSQIGIVWYENKRSWSWQKRMSKHVYIGESELEAILGCVEDAVEQNSGVTL